MELTPFRIERWYERFEFTTELMLSSSDCEAVSVADLLALEPDARDRLGGLGLGRLGAGEAFARLARFVER